SWTDATVRVALGLPDGGGRPRSFVGISTDTRTIAPGALYVALQGERFDGHQFLAAAARAGAAGAVVRAGTPPVEGLLFYEVADTLRALGDLGRARRRAVLGPVVAVTGSNGKTSTREMIAAVLRTAYRTHASRGNDNNLVGIPLSLLATPPGTEALVIEAGASEPGEIPRAREIIEPTTAVVTNVSPSHLEGFVSMEGILREKLALLDQVPLAIVGTEPPDLAERARRHAYRVVSAGLAEADRIPERLELDQAGHPTLVVEGCTIVLPLIGRHQAGNAMLAWALAQELDLNRARAAESLARLSIPGGRGEVLQVGGLTIVNDCYNANPTSFRAAIATAAAMRPGRRLVFVAGTMRELGARAGPLHDEVARALVSLGPEVLAAVGDFVPALAGYADALGDRLVTAPDPPALGPILAARLRGDELVVLKASRGVALERIIPHLTGPANSQS
ncbi:MAG: UDP-N-acetylmuramoyl-tripeptide--D-alanyl-D-alanine ligase, partial [Gemmatimonadales bacterium]